MMYTPRNWCPVCEGRGGWDKRSFVPRYKAQDDTKDTWMQCIWCGLGNVIGRVVLRNENEFPSTN